MKKIAYITLALLLLLSLAACGGGDSDKPTDTPDASTPEVAQSPKATQPPAPTPTQTPTPESKVETITVSDKDIGVITMSYLNDGSLIYEEGEGEILSRLGGSLSGPDFIMEIGYSRFRYDSYEEYREYLEEWDYYYSQINYGGNQGILHADYHWGQAFLSFVSPMGNPEWLIEIAVYSDETVDSEDDEAAAKLVEHDGVLAILETLTIEVYNEPEPEATPVVDNEPEDEGPEDEFIDAGFATFTICGGWQRDLTVEGVISGYRIEYYSDPLKGLVDISSYDFSSPQERADEIISAVSGVTQSDNITINGIEYLVVDNGDGMTYLITEQGSDGKGPDGSVIVYILGFTVDEVMPVLETMVIK